MEYNDKLLFPLDYYKNSLKQDFEKSVDEYIEALIKESNTDIAYNKKIVEKYYELLAQLKKITRKLNLLNILRVVMIIGTILSSIHAYHNLPYIIIPIGLIGLIFLLNPQIKAVKNKCQELTAETNKQLELCQKSMEALNNLLCSETTHDIIRKNIPFIHLDRNFNKKRYEQLKELYYLRSSDQNVDASATELVSGDILGNPFVIVGRLNHELIDHEYIGSRTVSYTEYYTDSEGETRSRVVTETLYASVVKPKPDYFNDVQLIYGCDAASKLTFSRRPSIKHNKSGFKLFNQDPNLKALKKHIKKTPSFIPMTDENFDAKFGALDRNNETEFRVLFTQIAQDNMLKLIEDDLYGDDFYFTKDHKINIIMANHTLDWNLDTSKNKVPFFDFEAFKKHFKEVNCDYFQHFYYLMIPVLSIPIYQQYKSKEYIYNNNSTYNYNGYLTETLANGLSQKYFKHPKSKTQAILKTQTYDSSDDKDIVKVTAYSYDSIQRVTYVATMAGNGHYYDVPVYWDEYIPLKQESYMEVLDTKMPEQEFNKARYTDKYKNILNNTSALCHKNDVIAFLREK